ncbi:(E2-independent) E3 ubiquitin-conjugating enzyme FATS isoform X2 [Siniperca chuatsi]|uniref:(E2-independent) E3 ubiquitin-conjugating enzyme FATS isoform X2 n=1 Tax=Siniperca chuatsi TaxID=119488 RepID=UPI001CE0F5C7|nr:(E2-independent) E3 ubiquitin-conjugating enzyme FATS isoform X2 [Siniperca chuatsi]
MTLRRPAAHVRRAPGWRRSGDESYWESLMSEGEVLPRVSRPPHAPRPQSAIEGGQLDGWLEHLQRMQSDLLRAPVHDQVPTFNDRTTSMPTLDRPNGHAWRQTGIPSFSRGSSSCGSPSLCESSLGSQDSLQTGFVSPPERRGSWERAHIMQAPRKEQAQLSYLAPVKIGWLPIQRKVMVANSCNQNQFMDHSAGQVKLKQSITPTFKENRATANRHRDGEVERSHTSPSALGVKTWQKADQGSTIIKQVPEKRSFPANEGDRPVGWQALRRGWNTNRVSAFPGGSQSNELPTGTSSDPNRKSPLMKTTSIEPLKHTSADPREPHTLPQDPHSHQSPEEVLALNAAAVIANIKLQRQLSKKKSPNGNSEKDSTARPQGNTDEGKCMKPHPDQSPVQRQNQPHAAFVPLSLDPERSLETISLQEALQRSRPDFISRSQGRVRELEERAQERRELADSVDPQSDAALRQRRAHSAQSTSLNDNLFKPRDRAIIGKEMQLRSKCTLAEVKRKKEKEKKREVCLSNRQRVELFKKKLLDQILQRSNS